MQTSDQSPEEPIAAQPAAKSGSEILPQSQDVQESREGREGREDQGIRRDQPVKSQSAVDASNIDHEAIRQGRIYPPPPSFYQGEDTHTSTQANPPFVRPEPAQPPPQETPYSYRGQTEYVPLPQAGNISTPPYPPYSSPPPYGAPPLYPQGQGYPGSQAPYLTAAKKSYKWVWILASILGVIIIASCGICAWASSSVFGNAFQQATTVVYGGRDLTNNYYEAIQNKRYSQAYSYLSPQSQLKNLTEVQYLKQAQSLDEQYGPVYKYTAGNPSVSYDTSGTNIDHFTITVDVTRAKKSYQVLLTVYKVGDQWKITNYTTI